MNRLREILLTIIQWLCWAIAFIPAAVVLAFGGLAHWLDELKEE